MSSLPSSLGKLQIIELCLDNNVFEAIPAVVSNLQKLQKFSASGNKDLTEISALIHCKCIQTIDVNETQISDMPMEFPLALPKLAKFTPLKR